MGLRRLVLLSHRWIGLPSAAILAITGATGAFLVWPGSYLLRRIAGRLHDTLALGPVGAWIVLIATAGAVILQMGGLFLWWKRKTLAVRTRAGWRRALVDLHHTAGALCLLLMLTLAVSGIGMRIFRPPEQPALRRVIVDFHTARAFPLPVKVLYTLGTMGFLIQGLTGVVMWWTTPRGTRYA